MQKKGYIIKIAGVDKYQRRNRVHGLGYGPYPPAWRFIVSDRVYRILKWACLIFIPATASLVYSIGVIWSVPYTDSIVGTMSAVSTFLGALIGISTIDYYKRNDKS